jgi:hypothetical protein
MRNSRASVSEDEVTNERFVWLHSVSRAASYVDTHLIAWLHSWQDLLGGIVGAVIGGGMGFIGAYVVASNQRKAERRAAVRVVIADLVGFRRFARQLDEKFRDDVVDPKHWSIWLSRRLHTYLYAVSPMLDHHLPQLFHGEDPKLSADLMAFATHYREVQVMLGGYDVPTKGAPPAEVAAAFNATREAAERALTRLETEYLAMFGVRRG